MSIPHCLPQCLQLSLCWLWLPLCFSTRVKKLRETLVAVQQLDKNMSSLRSWLSHIETELSRPIVYETCDDQEIQRKLKQQQASGTEGYNNLKTESYIWKVIQNVSVPMLAAFVQYVLVTSCLAHKLQDICSLICPNTYTDTNNPTCTLLFIQHNTRTAWLKLSDTESQHDSCIHLDQFKASLKSVSVSFLLTKLQL